MSSTTATLHIEIPITLQGSVICLEPIRRDMRNSSGRRPRTPSMISFSGFRTA